MKRTIISSIVLALFVLVLASCSTVESARSIRSIDVSNSHVLQMPLVSDLAVSEQRVSGIAQGTTGDSLDSLRRTAIANALDKSGGDVLLLPSFKVSNASYNVEVIVTGYSAKYTTPRPLRDSDVPLLEASRTNSMMLANNTELAMTSGSGQQEAKKKSIWPILLGTGGALLLLGLLAGG